VRLWWADLAIADRIAIYDYIEADNPRAAVELDDAFLKAAERLRTHPDIGRLGKISGTRELVAHRNYVLVYELIDNAVCMLAVVHTSRQWPSLSAETQTR
jgi:toxin ParE1/3/4